MDLIYAGRYTDVCDYSWDDYKDKLELDNLQPGIWHVDPSAIPEFFDHIKTSRHNYIVVSPSCDFGVCLQRYNHPAMDLEKWIGLQATPGHGYNDLHMGARIREGHCNETDKYSIKCWSYTHATFNEIPDQVVKWFCVNAEVDDPRVVPIPFGVGSKEVCEQIEGYPERTRDKLLYVNFQFYNTDRYRLFAHLNRYPEVTCKQQVPFDEFLEDLATHKYVLCPPGNGLDCYRTLESIYMGAIPILEKRVGCIAPYRDLVYPIAAYDNLFQIDLVALEQSYNLFMSHSQDTTEVTWPHWESKIELCRFEL